MYPHELKTLALRHKTDTELTVVRFIHYGVYIIGIEFLCIEASGGEQLIIQQGGRVDIDVEVFKQTAVQFQSSEEVPTLAFTFWS